MSCNSTSEQKTTSKDAFPPKNSFIMIKDNNVKTPVSNTVLSLTAEDDVAVVVYYISEDSQVPRSDDARWVKLSQPAKELKLKAVPFTLSKGNGIKNLYVWFMDEAGNISAPATATTEFTESEAIKAFAPANASMDVDYTPEISVEFKVPMDPATINDTAFKLGRFYAWSETPVQGNVKFDEKLNKVLFVPAARLQPGLYGVTLSKDVMTLAGNRLVGDVNWVFITKVPVKAPLFAPAPGPYESPTVTVSITSPENLDIYFTTDGTEPTPLTGTKYNVPIIIDRGYGFKAIAALSEQSFSPVSPADYDILWWSFVPGGMTGAIFDIVAGNNTDLYVGGYFKNANVGDGTTESVNNIAKWNAASRRWQDLDTGASAAVRALLFDGKKQVLYAGGDFLKIGHIAVDHIARWDGTTWNKLATTAMQKDGVDGTVFALAMDNSNHLYVGGFFNNAGGKPAENIAMWDGLQWSALGQGVNGKVHDIAIDSKGMVYAVGEFKLAGGKGADLIAQWNPDTKQWSSLPGLINLNNGCALAIDKNDTLYVGLCDLPISSSGKKGVAKWDGNSWNMVGNEFNASVYGLKIINDELYAGSRFSKAGDYATRSIEKWDGHKWVGVGINRSVFSIQGSKLTVLGQPSQMTLESLQGNVSAIASDALGSIYIVGDFSQLGNYPVIKWGLVE
ncbi:MAG: FN3 associated domain-containing protein [Pseudomonadota bacterium]